MKKIFQCLLLSVLLLLTVSVSAAQPDIIKLSEQATVKKFPDARNVLLYDVETMTYQKDGTSVNTDEFYYKILTEAGRKELSSIPLHSNDNYGSAAFLAAGILRNGKMINIDIAGHTTLTTETEQMSSNIYDPEMKVTTLTVPGLKVGDILYIKSERKITKPLIPGEWSTINVLESDIPILRYDVIIDMPSELPLQNVVIKNEVKGTISELPTQRKNGRIIRHWQALNVPQAIPENGMPKLYTCCQRLLAGTCKEWQDISKWYYNLSRPAMDAVSQEMRDTVAELVKNTNSSDEKIQRIFKYVSQNIRYTGVTAEKNAPGYEPHAVCDTFKQKHGVCRDKAALLATMLELAGFKAYPALFMAGTPKDKDVPNGYFNHAVTCVDKGNFDYVLMDPTDENTRTLFPEYLSNQSYIVARPEGDTLRRSPVIAPDKNKMKITTDSAIDSRGTMSGKSKVELFGMSDLIYRSSFSRMSKDKILEFWQGRIRKALPGAKVLTLDIAPENIRDTSKPVVVNFTFKSEKVLPAGGDVSVLAVPRFGTQFGTFYWLLPDTSLLQRRFPIETESTCKLEEEFTLKLPPHFEVCGVPQEKGGKEQHFSWNNKYSCSSNTIKYSGTASLDAVEISEKDYPAFKDELNRFETSSAKLPAVKRNYLGFTAKEYKKMFPAADAVLLDSDTKVILENDSTCTNINKKKILVLNYAGVKQYSELKVSYFPSREKIDVTAKVTSPDGKIRTLSESSTRVMDAPWTADLKHVPAEKIKVCALPGVSEGSIIEYTVTRKAKELHPISGVAVIQQHAPVLSWQFEIDAPEKLKIYTSAVPEGATFTTQNSDKRVIRRWKAENIDGLKKEYSQSELRFFAPHINYSTVNAKEFPQRFNEMLNEKVNGKNSVAKKACFAEMPSDLDIAGKAKYIRDFVTRKIRVTGPALCEVPEKSLRTPDKIYSSASATSAERAILMASLFKSAGIEYRFYLASSKPFHAQVYRNSFSLESAFETVLLYVPELNAYFNDSSEYAQLGFTSYCGKLGLDLETGRVASITSQADSLNHISIDYTVKIRANGSALINVVEHRHGTYYENTRRTLEEMTPELRNRYFLEKANALSSSARLVGKYSYDFTEKRGTVKYSVIIPDFAHKSGKYMIYELPGYGILRDKAAVFGAERQTPFVRRTPDKVTLNWRISAPEGYSYRATETRSKSTGHSQFAELTERRRATAREEVVSVRLTLPVAYVEPSDYDRLISVQNESGSNKLRYGTMKKNDR